jgi:hypothetical protein
VTVNTPQGTLVQPGDFAVVHVTGSTGKLIHLGEILNGDGFADYEHAIMYVGGAQDLIIEAEPGGARVLPCHYDAASVLWSSDSPLLALTDGQREMTATLADKYKGTPYSALDYFALAAHRLHIWAPGLKGRIASSGHMICSQLVDQLRLDMNNHLFIDGRWPGYVTPADLANLISSSSGKPKAPG